MGIGGGEYGLMISLYSFPNIVLVVVGGYYIDRMPLWLAYSVFGLLLVAGTAVVAFGGSLAPMIGNQGAFVIMLVGRFVYGIGAESFYVVQNTALSEWFSDSKVPAPLFFSLFCSFER